MCDQNSDSCTPPESWNLQPLKKKDTINHETSYGGLEPNKDIKDSGISGEPSNKPLDYTYEITKLLIHWILGITSGFLFLTFLLFCYNLGNDKYLELIKSLIPIITFLLGVISTLGFVNYKISDSGKK